MMIHRFVWPLKDQELGYTNNAPILWLEVNCVKKGLQVHLLPQLRDHKGIPDMI